MSSVTASFEPWPHQVGAFNALINGHDNRIVTVWHRRAGKDLAAFNAMWIMAMRNKGNYAYFFPTYAQGKKAVWYGQTNDGLSFMDHIPEGLIEKTHDTEMRIHLTNGSMIQVIGTDNIDSIVGTNYLGAVFSEYSLQDPRGWRYISPILRMNGGWAWFTYTPRGKENHGYTLYDRGLALMAKGRPWYVEKLGIEETGLLTDADLDDDRATGMDENLIRQEYYCDFGVTNLAAYFGEKMMKLEEQGRINDNVVWNPRNPVHTAWDFGVNDSTCIWFLQSNGRGSWHAVDYYWNHNEGLEHYAKVVKEKPYYYGTHLVPHDGDQREFQTNMSKVQAAIQYNLDFTVVPRTAKLTQIDATHRTLPNLFFNKDLCEQGVSALKNYERRWDDKLKVFANTPLHNWASHGTDAFMTFALGQDLCTDYMDDDALPTRSVGAGYDPRGDFDNGWSSSYSEPHNVHNRSSDRFKWFT